MFGQASNHWLSPTLLLLVAFFTVHLSSSLSSNVDDEPHYLDNFPSMMQLSETDLSLPTTPDWKKCLNRHLDKTAKCARKAQKKEFAEVTEKDCRYTFALVKCATKDFCHYCKEFSFEDYSNLLQRELDHWGDKCNQWPNLKPNLSTSCPDESADDSSGEQRGDSQGQMFTTTSDTWSIVIFVAVAVVVVGICGLIAWGICCRKKKYNSNSKSKSLISSQSSESRSKSMKAKSTNSSKSGKSMKAKSTKG